MHLAIIFVELDVPVDVIAPTVGRVANAERDADGRRLVGPAWVTDQMHARLLGRASALPAVAGDAAGDDVFPILAAALRDGHDVIEREIRRGKRVAAVLAGVVIARVDVR